MATAFLTLNGVGLGHLVRATVVARALASVGERAVIFSQGLFPLDANDSIPGRAVPSLWKADDAVRRQIGADLRSMVEISLPAVVIEDTHPSPVRLPARVRRVLLVRPTTFAYLQRLRREYARVYRAFLITDAPDSPTWPYSPDETAAIARWSDWHVIGPLYQQPTQEALAEIRHRYAIDGTRRVLVCTLGGGGRHSPDDNSPRQFADFCSGVADALRASREAMRLLFVKGPYFPPDVTIDPRFEVLGYEPGLAALLASADGVVARAGFNTLWECLSGGVPFWPFVGTTFDEPVAQRVARLRDQDLVAPDAQTFWSDDAWRARFRRACLPLAATWSGSPRDPAHLWHLIAGPRQPHVRWAVSSRDTNALARTTRFVRRQFSRVRRRPRTPLIIRIDDVVSIDATLDWLLRLLMSRGACASLEVVPYLADLGERHLVAYDPRSALFEISQHGYAHLPRSGVNRRRFEFSPEPLAGDAEAIARGKRVLDDAFPARFRGGFSAPFDALPGWLPRCWHAAGGQFISSLSDRTNDGSPVPIVVAGWDIWNWTRDESHTRQAILETLERQTRAHGHAGIALHPRCLRSHVERHRLVDLLDRLLDQGFSPVPLHSLASR